MYPTTLTVVPVAAAGAIGTAATPKALQTELGTSKITKSKAEAGE
jgi:hypothetical protein